MNPPSHSNVVLGRGKFLITLVVFSLLAWPRHSIANSATAFLQCAWQTDHGLSHNIVNALHQTSDGYLWLGTRRGVARFDGIRFVPIDVPELKIQNVTALCEDRDGVLWMATEGGVFQSKNGRTSHIGRADGLAGDNVRALFKAKDDS